MPAEQEGASLPWQRLKRLGVESHLVEPLLFLLAGSCLLMGLELDQKLATWLFTLQGGQWQWKDAWLAEQVIHRGGRSASIIAGLTVLIAALASRWRSRWLPLHRPLLRLFTSIAVATVVVSLCKRISGMDCPWDLVVYGGSHEFYGVFDPRPAGFVASGCFPAGHSSAGFAWIAMYFLLMDVAPRYRWMGLLSGLVPGIVFGFTQQVRGAHFLSHDLWTLAICWFVALGLYTIWPASKVCSSHAGTGPALSSG